MSGPSAAASASSSDYPFPLVKLSHTARHRDLSAIRASWLGKQWDPHGCREGDLHGSGEGGAECEAPGWEWGRLGDFGTTDVVAHAAVEGGAAQAGDRNTFHCHSAVLRSFSPVLARELDAATAAASRAREAAVAAEVATTLTASSCSPPRTRPRSSRRGGGAAWSHLELHLEAGPRVVADVLAFMYGMPVEFGHEEMLRWPVKGCDHLRLARDLRIDKLERAMRGLILEAAAGCARPALTWALLHVSHDWGFGPELRYCCAEVARSERRLKDLRREALAAVPLGALATLLQSRAWIVDSEGEVLDVLEAWTAACARVRGGGDAGAADLGSRLLATSGSWDVRWGGIPKLRLKKLARSGIVPQALVQDCENWQKLHYDTTYHLSLVSEAVRKQHEAAGNERARKLELHAAEQRCLRSRPHSVRGLEPDAGGPEEESGSPKDKLKQHVDSARAALEAATRAAEQAQSEVETRMDMPMQIRLSNETFSWRAAALGAEARGADDEAVQRFLATCVSSERCQRRPSEEMWAPLNCAWLVPRRCFHVHFRPCRDSAEFFESYGTRQDHTVMRFKLPGRRVFSLPASRASQATAAPDDLRLQQAGPLEGALLLAPGPAPFERTRSLPRPPPGRANVALLPASIRYSQLRSPSKRRTVALLQQGSPAAPAGGDAGATPRSRPETPQSILSSSPADSCSPSKRSSYAQQELASPAAYVVGTRRVSCGQHAAIFRVVVRRSRTSEHFTTRSALRGFRFGVGTFTSAEDHGDSPDPGSCSPGRTQGSSPAPAPAAAELPPKCAFVPPEILAANNHLKSAGFGNVLDFMAILVLDFKRDQALFGVDQLQTNEDDCEHAFFCRRSFGYWADDENLSKELAIGLEHVPSEGGCCFVAEFNPKKFEAFAGPNASVELEVLPPAALRRSWWIDAMGRSVDTVPRGPYQWAPPA